MLLAHRDHDTFLVVDIMLPNKNFVKSLNDIKLFGTRFTVTEISYFDN